MKTTFCKRWYLFVPLILLVMIACGFVTMWLWNWLMPAIFTLPVISFWQTVGLLVLSHLLLGGMRGHHHGYHHGSHHRRGRMLEKWENMTPEEREKFSEHIRMHRPPWIHHCPPEESI